MALDSATIAKLAEHLETAELEAYDVTKITDDRRAAQVATQAQQGKLRQGHLR